MNFNVQHSWTEPFPEMRQAAKQRQIPIIPDETAQYLDYLIQNNLPDRILELGTAIGYSSMLMASARNFKGSIITVDSSLPATIEATKNIRDYGFEKQIQVIFSKAIPFLEKCRDYFDFIFIDAKKSEYPDYFRLSKKKLNPGGSIILDNLYWHGTVSSTKEFADSRVTILREFNLSFLNDRDGQTEILDIGDGLGIFKKK